MRQAHIAFPSVEQKKFIHIPNGFESGDLPREDDALTSASQSNTIQLAFLGALGPHTPADGFLQTVKQLLESEPIWRTRLRIHFVGQRHRSAEPALSDTSLADIISLQDQVSKPAAIGIMRESRALIAFNPPALERYIPGKLFDYIASGRPILVYGDGGEVASIVKELDAGIIVPENDVARLRDALMQLAAKTAAVGNGNGKREQWLRRHERAALADQLLQHIVTLLPSGATQK
jgi:glycosyltransferase involved in cell wall biosynthesis